MVRETGHRWLRASW